MQVTIRSDPHPSSLQSKLHSLLESIPLNSSHFLHHPHPSEFIRFLRYAARTFHRRNPTSHLSIYLVSAPGQPTRGTSRPIGIQIWHTSRSEPSSEPSSERVA